MLFELKIKLGNSEMCSGLDVAGALREVATSIGDSGAPEHIEAGIIRDANGNSVGEWSFSASVSEQLSAWASSLTVEQLQAKRADIPFEVREHEAEELRAIDEELEKRKGKLERA